MPKFSEKQLVNAKLTAARKWLWQDSDKCDKHHNIAADLLFYLKTVFTIMPGLYYYYAMFKNTFRKKYLAPH